MTSPSVLSPPSTLNLPEPVYGNNQQALRPPSPLRNGFTLDSAGDNSSEDGSDGEDDDHNPTWGQPHSPSSSVTKLASSFAQRVGSFVNNMNARPDNGHPSDAEIEAEAERERDRSRREAERILMREAEERRKLEGKVAAMLESSRPATPQRAQTMPESSSPAGSQKEGGPSWWAAAKSRLTPTKEPLSPAQQIVQETKEREKKGKKNAKQKEKGRDKSPSRDRPASDDKYADSALFNLAIPVGSPRRQFPGSPSSPTLGSPQPMSLPPSLAPSPLRSTDGHVSSPSRESTPLYAQFNAQGTLDIAGTLLLVAKRFEKLEKWTVSHVRALEERMSDVERWLVDKEKEKEEYAQTAPENASQAVSEMQEEIIEVQGRIGELGREMAKLATAPANLSSGPSRSPPSVSSAPPTSSVIAIHSLPPVAPVLTTPRVVSGPRRRDSMSPPFVPSTVSSSSSHTPRSRLPYPTGDYATPPDTALLSQGVFSPANSPPSSITSATRSRPISISGLPSLNSNSLTGNPQSSTSGLPRPSSPPVGSVSPSSNLTQQSSRVRGSSISPTPTKRYTVALGGPIMNPSERSSRSDSSGNVFSSSPGPMHDDLPDDDRDESYDDTIGKSAGRLSVYNNHNGNGNGKGSASDTSPTPSPRSSRIRAQSTYGSLTTNSPSMVTPLRPRLRSKSTDRFGVGLGISDGSTMPSTPSTGKFVDPLLVRKQEKRALASAAPPTPKEVVGKRKVPVGELVAFFDGDKF
ncbi:hypothetical protein EW146_g3111 [Bondarzewia mesenterica]|uniref:Uncharacterized protein n=1 Tax=Bondarzewia mesenterica TaxID=1095465 RepID=A0A4S4M4H5_9AGAM|nr:hypothetical protein EW146_g3111 [Bondarzewia mesenterica]